MKNVYDKALLLKKHILKRGAENLLVFRNRGNYPDTEWCVFGDYKGQLVGACADSKRGALIRFALMLIDIDNERKE